jgi:hypothetical protein
MGIKQAFYETNAKLFPGYWEYLVDGTFEISAYIEKQHPGKSEMKTFYDSMFKNNNYVEPKAGAPKSDAPA